MESLIPMNQGNVALFAALLIWTLVWKGIALWKAARLSHRNWFIILFIANTFGILEIAYIYFVASKYKVESVEAEGDKEGGEERPAEPDRE